MEIKKIKNGSTLTIIPEGRIDTTTAPELHSFISNNIEGITDLIFDLSNVNYISSAGLRVFMSFQKIMNMKGRMSMTNVNEEIMDIFEITGLSEVFTIK